MAVDMGHSTNASAMAGMDMGMGMMKNMHMNMWLTPTYNDYPVLFQHLRADTNGKAFGIFLLIVVAAFVYKFITFTSWCLEVHWFKKWNKDSKYASIFPAANKKNNANDPEIMEAHVSGMPRVPNLLRDIFMPSFTDLFHDFIRAILAFISTMIIYCLMLVAMTYVLTYVFAVVTGLALAEVFFNRIKIALMKRWDIQREIALAAACGAKGECECGPNDPRSPSSGTSTEEEYDEKHGGHNHKEFRSASNMDDNCNCETPVIAKSKQEKRIERETLENSRMQEQANTMAPDLTPADGLH